MDANGTPPLAGLRVLELGPALRASPSGLLAGLGADVVRAEAGEAPTRGAMQADAAEIARALRDRGKRVVHVTGAGDPQLAALIDRCDLLIEASGPGKPVLVDREALARRRPELVILALSPFGMAGPLSHWRGGDALAHAMGGGLSRSGNPDRPPLLPPDGVADGAAAGQAAFVALLALWQRARSGVGDLLDCAISDAAARALDPAFGIQGSATAGTAFGPPPRGRPEARFLYPILPCADGFVRYCVLSPRQWRGMFAWMGEPAEFADPSFERLLTRYMSPTLLPAIAAFSASRTGAELEAGAQEHGVPLAYLQTLEAALDSPQLAARNAIGSVSVGGATLAAPRGPGILDGARIACDAQSTDGTGASARFGEALPALLAAGASDTATAGLPLAGLLVLDMGVIVVGAETGRLLADAGATVIKIENPDFPDGSRQTRPGDLITAGFAAGHRNKRSLSLNLRHAEGKALLEALLARADVLLSNFKPGTLDSLGFGTDRLRAINPALVMVDSSAFGSGGPWAGRMGYGPLVRASAGLSLDWRYPGEPDGFADALTVYPDHVAARIGASCALAMLLRRRANGSGGQASLAQSEVMLSHLAETIATGDAVRQGMLAAWQAEPDAPHGVYSAAGDDEWVVVAGDGDAHWASLAPLIGLADDPVLATRQGRVAARARIDAAMTAWLASRAPGEAAEQLQQAGVPAAPMLRMPDMPGHPHYAAQQFLSAMVQPQLAEPLTVERVPVLARHLPDPPRMPAPLMGEHSRELLAELLGLEEARIDALIADGVVSIQPDAEQQ